MQLIIFVSLCPCNDITKLTTFVCKHHSSCFSHAFNLHVAVATVHGARGHGLGITRKPEEQKAKDAMFNPNTAGLVSVLFQHNDPIPAQLESFRAELFAPVEVIADTFTSKCTYMVWPTGLPMKICESKGI